MRIRTTLLLFTLLLGMGMRGRAEIAYPWKNVFIGAMDATSWAGLVLAPHPDTSFAFKIRINRGTEAAEGIDFYYLVSEVGPHSPDGRYARVKFDLSLPFGQGDDTPILKKPSSKSTTMTLEWSRQNEDTVIGRILAPKDIQVQLIHYFPWEARGRYRLREDGQLEGEGLALQKFHYLFWTSRPGTLEGEGEGSEVVLSYPIEKNRAIYFAAGVGEDPEALSNRIYRYLNEKTIQSFLAEEAQIYDQNRVRALGAHRGLAAAVTNNLFWGSLYQPGRHRFYTPSGRNRLSETPGSESPLWMTFSGDSFFNALVLSLESTKHAKDMLKVVLETQYPNGNIPHWRAGEEGSPDRSQPPIGAYVVLKLFQKTGDEELLHFAYPYLTRWHAFWTATKSNGLIRRDGNGDGLLEWGSDSELVVEDDPPWMESGTGKDRARMESGMPDLPNWEEAGFDRLTGTMTMNCLDLNCLFALDAWCLAQMASVLNYQTDSSEYLSEYEVMKQLVNDNFWDSQRGLYFDRHWDGRISRKMSVTSFYPLLARIPDAERARQMRAHLLDRSEFWGDYVIPSVSRSSESYQEQLAWRGAVWPSANYLTYQGLKAFGMDVEAQEFARKSADLFLLTWKNFQICPQNYDSRTGGATGHRYQSWGPLMALIALEELIDITPWEGFRFGVLQPDRAGEVRRIAIQGRHYDVRVSSGEVRLKEEGREIVRSKGGMVFRRFLYNEQLVSFDVMTLAKRKIRIRFLTEGKYQYFLDDQLKKIFSGDSVDIEVPEGGHAVLIMLVEKAR
jgi:hypothetical protein